MYENDACGEIYQRSRAALYCKNGKKKKGERDRIRSSEFTMSVSRIRWNIPMQAKKKLVNINICFHMSILSRPVNEKLPLKS